MRFRDRPGARVAVATSFALSAPSVRQTSLVVPNFYYRALDSFRLASERSISYNLLAMAFRIHDNVVRGEIDNRTKGLVRGTIWMEGRAEPITLDLKGNAHPDLAGCLLTFNNPGTCIVHPNLESLASPQCGAVGDMTAARKEHVFGVAPDVAYAMLQRNEIPPEHIANVLYLEWFSQSNGRWLSKARTTT